MKRLTYGAGIRVFCDELIAQDETIIAVSMVGREGPLQAVCAALVEGKAVTLKSDDAPDKILRRANRRCSYKKTPLGDGLIQGVFFNAEEKDRITTRDQFFLAVNALFKYPFHEAWVDFLFNETLKNGRLAKLDVYSEIEEKEYYKIDFDEGQFAQMIFDNIKILKNLIN